MEHLCARSITCCCSCRRFKWRLAEVDAHSWTSGPQSPPYSLHLPEDPQACSHTQPSHRGWNPPVGAADAGVSACRVRREARAPAAQRAAHHQRPVRHGVAVPRHCAVPRAHERLRGALAGTPSAMMQPHAVVACPPWCAAALPGATPWRCRDLHGHARDKCCCCNIQAATSDVSSILQQQWAGTSRYETGEGHDPSPDSGAPRLCCELPPQCYMLSSIRT